MRNGQPLEICHVIAGLDPRSGGTSVVSVQLTDALAENAELMLHLLTQASQSGNSVASHSGKVQRTEIGWKGKLSEVAALEIPRVLKHLAPRNACAILHGHGLWLPINHWSARHARKHNIPLVIQPHGMLEPWALRHKFLKKWVAMTLFQRRDLKTACLFLANSYLEYQHLRQLGLTQPIAVIPNGIPVIEPASGDAGRSLEKRQNKALFLSRIHPKKGLVNLIQAWRQARPEGWRLQIAGPDEGGHRETVMTVAMMAGITSDIDYLGELYGEEKTAAYRNADLFILPTFSESFGVAVAEALSFGLPVITTKGAPWQDLQTYRCGWWIDIGVDPLAQAIRQATRLGEGERLAMGERGRRYAQRFDWGEIACQMESVYRWVLDLRAKHPSCVHLD